MKNIKVLVVDDSVLMRRIISDAISSHRRMEVIGTAKNGLKAVEMTAKMRPDVVLMDIQMPEMDGLEALSHIMKENPTPVVILSAMDARDADIVLQSLEIGAVDFVSKPSGKVITVLDDAQIRRLLTVVRSAVFANISPLEPTEISEEPKITRKPPLTSPPVITIGASTGGPKSIRKLLSHFPADIPAYILVVQHMPPGFTTSFAERLANLTDLKATEAKDGEPLATGKVLVAPGGYHMTVEQDGENDYTIRLDRKSRVNNVRPSVDVTMESVAEVFGSNTIGVLLTGMGRDGAKGMLAIKKKGGKTLAEDRSTSVIYGMPKAAVELGCVDRVVPLQRIPLEIMNLLT